MLRCNMSNSSISLQLGLEDLLGDLQFARRSGDLGRIALLAYCEVRRWARMAGEQELETQSSDIVNNSPHTNREEFMAEIDSLITKLEQARSRIVGESPTAQAEASHTN